MAYQNFLIAPFGTGLDTDQSPWLLPQDAFSDISNGHIHHGVVEKRDGYTKHGDFVHQDQTNWKISGITQANPAVVTVTATTGLTNGDVVELRNVPGMTEVNGQKYTVANLGGTTFELSGVNSTSFTAYGAGTGDVLLIPSNRVMGLHRYIDSDNVKEVIAFDQTRACKYNSTNQQYDPIDSSDIMDAGSDNTDFIWADNWASTASSTASTLYRLYFTNGRAYSGGLNGIRYYDGGTATTSYRPQINSLTYIDGCKLLFSFRQRLVLLDTIEGGVSYPQRARWCQVQAPSVSDAWDDNRSGKGGYVDAPTGDHIISAEFLQDVLIVFFTSSVWMLRANPDPALPFVWNKINDFRACNGKMTATQFDRYVIAAGSRGLTATDGVETQRLDERIEDFTSSEINTGEFAKVFSKRSYEKRRLWMLYPGGEDDDPNNALIYDEESSAYSKYAISLNVLGYGGAAQDAALDSFGDKRLDEFSETLLDFTFDAAAELFLGGDRSGTVWSLEQGGDDNEIIFESSIVGVTQANPGVVTMGGDSGLSNGDIVTISGIVGMTELNDREFTVAGKSGNTFQLQGEDTSGYTAYTSGGDVRTITADSIDFSLKSAAWNPWISEGRKAELGYVDLFLDTHPSTLMTVNFFKDNDDTPYATSIINLLPDLLEIAEITSITNANPGNVTAADHGLATGDEIFIYGVGGMNAVNDGPYTVTVVDSGNFTIGVDTTNYGVYTNGGTITERQFTTDKAWKRVFAGETGYQHRIEITSSGRDKPLNIHAFMPWFKPRGSRII